MSAVVEAPSNGCRSSRSALSTIVEGATSRRNVVSSTARRNGASIMPPCWNIGLIVDDETEGLKRGVQEDFRG